MKNVADIYPLSPVQLGMLFHTLANPQAGVYVNQYTCKLTGQVQPARLQQAWQKTVARLPVLRTAFLWEGLDEPLQVVRQAVDLPWQQLDWRGLSDTEQATQLEDFLQRDRTQGFDLAQAPLLRLTLICLSEEPTYQLIWSSHHLLFDGWSLPLIWQDMLAYYAALLRGVSAPLEPVRPYRDYIAWQQSQDFTTAETFWRSQLQGFSEPTPLPAARTAVSESAQRYHQQTKVLTPSLTAALKTLGREHRLTLNTLIQGAWALLLSHYSSGDPNSGGNQVTYGSVVAGRPADLSGVETMVGLFINTLPVRISIEPEQPLLSWLQARQQQLLDLRQYEATPLADIQRWSDLPAGSPLFESIVVFENYPTATTPDLGFEVSDIRYLEQSNYPLALLVVPDESLEFLLLYDPSRFEQAAIVRLLDHLELLLTAFVEQPHVILSDLPRLTPAEQQQLNSWQPIDYPRDRCIHELIEVQVKKTPEAPAVIFADQTLTYAELDQRANQLANELRSHSVVPGDRVAICLDPSPERIVSILAILKTGAAYVPLDPTYPEDRLGYCLQDTAPRLLFTQRSVILPDTSVPVLYLDENVSSPSAPSSPTPPNPELGRHKASPYAAPSRRGVACNAPTPRNAAPSDLAYVIYTSGSTGQPKGVMVTHRNLVHSTTARSHIYPDPVGRFLLLSSIAFDSSVAGIFWTLCQGGTLVLPPQRIEQDLQQLATLIAQQQITHTLCVPTLYSLLLDAADPQQLATLHTVIVAGEVCPRPLAQQHYAKLPNADLYNEYGPTEATVWSTVYRIPADLAPGPISIGHPIPNTRVYLLDASQKPVPFGAIGELYIGGDGVTQGYLNRPEKTAAAFVEIKGEGRKAKGERINQKPHFILHPTLREEQSSTSFILYKTGDLARYSADGTLEWLGRCDRQVKIRGYRIELGEIEEALRQHESVREAVVIQSATRPAQLSDSVESLVAALSALEPERAEALLSAVEEGP